MPIDLTSLERVKERVRYASAKTVADNLLRLLITEASGMVERYLNRHIIRQARTEQHDVEPGQMVFLLKGYPVASSPAPVFKSSTDRDFVAALAVPDETFYVKLSTGKVEFDTFLPSFGPGTLQVVYTGGMAPTIVRLNGVPGAETGTPAVNQTVSGQTSGARGTIKEFTTGVSISVDVLSGHFVAGEILDDEAAANTVVLTSITDTPLAMAIPDVVTATEEQVAHLWKNRDKVGLSSFSSEGGSFTVDGKWGELLPGVLARLRRYRKKAQRAV